MEIKLINIMILLVRSYLDTRVG